MDAAAGGVAVDEPTKTPPYRPLAQGGTGPHGWPARVASAGGQRGWSERVDVAGLGAHEVRLLALRRAHVPAGRCECRGYVARGGDLRDVIHGEAFSPAPPPLLRASRRRLAGGFSYTTLRNQVITVSTHLEWAQEVRAGRRYRRKVPSRPRLRAHNCGWPALTRCDRGSPGLQGLSYLPRSSSSSQVSSNSEIRTWFVGAEPR